MRIDKTKLTELTRLSDDEFWKKIREITAPYGVSLPEKTPKKNELDALRLALNDSDSFSLAKAMKLIKDYKRRNP